MDEENNFRAEARATVTALIHEGEGAEPWVAETRTERIVEGIEDDILQGRLAPGARLDEVLLAERYGVSRTPVREALKQLSAAGLVVIRPHQGALVAIHTRDELIEMFEAMAELEATCARLATRRMTPRERLLVEEAHLECRRLAETGDVLTFFRANSVLHGLLYEACHNRFLRQQTESLNKRLMPYRRLITFREGRLAESIAEHDAVVGAVLSGDAEAASRQMRHHLEILGDDAEAILRALDRQTRAGTGS
ncbi:GntR family transcriptional regulator [Zavarzinia sp.]|uniref:GntR family transcriptional regulator n=1 Tax=Zavarzinia sp. TaxID=2027920 RepID=UPI0035686BB4